MYHFDWAAQYLTVRGDVFDRNIDGRPRVLDPSLVEAGLYGHAVIAV